MEITTKKLTQDIIQWDVKNWSKALAFWDNVTDWKNVFQTLELGGRQGGISLWLAHKGKDVVCSDYSDTQITATPLHQVYQVQDKIQYQDIDATNIPYENHFDLIVFKSIIGGIGRNNNIANQEEVFRQIYKALKPGGKLLFAENLIASPIHNQLRKRFTSWGDTWRYVSVDEMTSFLRNFKSFELHTTGVLATFGRNEKQRNLLAHADHYFFNHICPKNWRYISYGMAEK